MSRLTTEKDVKEMGMYELAHNSCYAKDGKARYRDFETDIDCRDLARKLMVDYGLWKSIPEHGLDAHNELVDDDIFDESILENLWYGLDTLEGLIALFYRNLWAMADLRTKLKHYEDLEEQLMESAEIDIDSMVGEFMHYYNLQKENRLIELPCAVGDTVYLVDVEEQVYDEAKVDEIVITKNGIELNSDYEIGTLANADYIAYDIEELATKLKELEE